MTSSARSRRAPESDRAARAVHRRSRARRAASTRRSESRTAAGLRRADDRQSPSSSARARRARRRGRPPRRAADRGARSRSAAPAARRWPRGSRASRAWRRPPRAELAAGEGMDAWIDTYHSVRRLTRQGTYVFLTDSAVGLPEEDNLRHLVTNLGRDVPRERIVPFLTTKHALEYCLSYAE